MIAMTDTTPNAVHILLDGPAITLIGLSFDKGELRPIEDAIGFPHEWQS